MAASLDGFVARKDGRVDWLETSDEFADGETPDLRFFDNLDRDIPLHLTEIKAYKSGMVGLCYEVRGHGEPRNDTQRVNT